MALYFSDSSPPFPKGSGRTFPKVSNQLSHLETQMIPKQLGHAFHDPLFVVTLNTTLDFPKYLNSL